MAAYAEFLAHYYDRRLRPMSAYTMGWIYGWARAAGYAPRLINWATRDCGRRDAYHFAQVLHLAFKVGVRDHWIAPERPPRAA